MGRYLRMVDAETGHAEIGFENITTQRDEGPQVAFRYLSGEA